MTGLSYAALAILKYSSDHNDVVSDTTVELIPYLREEHFEVFNSGLLCCPESGAEFRLVSGLTMSSDPNSLLAYCPTAHSWESKTDVGYNVLFVDSTIRSLSQEDFMQAKETDRALLDRLPDDCSLEDVLYHLYVIQAVKEGRTLTPVQVVEDLDRKWVVGRGA